ncbi:ABC transporter substrate-binding protein [Clostridium sp. Sa3CUN1]|uniref:ABC transporter substrate-binding protein n=1 Tax=Clostridium gallinarum TaxID=2762246 RepID=A0ABR8Q3C0_9CLOT|nr:ABC transporter substrate-binding protein [Clostridium gallinarum]MBD7914932.1 ABC transporter substrate-binding protein [Clostridium gallinarum]
MKSKLIKIASIMALVGITTLSLVSCTKKTVDTTKELTKIRLNEVVRSVFYAPMYVAINEGFFEEEGLEIDLSTGQGADKTMQQVLSKNADIGFCGPEQTVYINNQGREDYPVLFAQLTQTDGAFLVGREAKEDFKWSDLKGAEIIGGRPGGVPEMAFEYALKLNGLDPKTDVNMVTNIDFTATSGAFKAGTGEYVTLFEPTASMLEKEGTGKIITSIGREVGDLPYTCFFATKSYMDKNPEIIQSFTNAIYKGQQWVETHSNEEIADSIISFFPGTDKDIIVSVVKNYKEIDAIATKPTIEEEDLTRLMDVIESYDSSLLSDRPDFNKIVNNSFAEESMKK